MTENCLLSPLRTAKGLTPTVPLDGRGDYCTCSFLEDRPLSQHRPGHCHPLHAHCPRAHSHRICVSRLSAPSLLCWAGGSRQKAIRTQQEERQTPTVGTCCAKELWKCCYSKGESATTRCEGRSPDVGGMSGSHNWERCLPP